MKAQKSWAEVAKELQGLVSKLETVPVIRVEQAPPSEIAMRVSSAVRPRPR